MMKDLSIDRFRISMDSPTLIVAEISANHNQSYDLAVKTIHAIAESGADAVKVQTYTADTLTIDVKNENFRVKAGSIWDGKYYYDLYKEAYTPWDWQPRLKKIAEELGLIFFSSPFDPSSVDFLYNLNVPAYKVASFEITDIPLIEYMASKGKPVIISTGIATLEDINEAVTACRRMNNDQILLLKCTSAYPAPLEDINLRVIPDLAEKFNVHVGLSDHTLGNIVPVGAVILGAKMIEKHFILDRTLGGPDSSFSMEPSEFRLMVDSIRQIEKAAGRVNYDLTENMIKSRTFARSLFAVEHINAGEKLTNKNVRSIRPGYGLPPKYLKDVLGKTAKEEIKKGTPLTWEIIE